MPRGTNKLTAKNVRLAALYGAGKPYLHKKFALGFAVSNEMVEDDLYGNLNPKVIHMKEIRHYKLDKADFSMMDQLGMDEQEYLVYLYDVFYEQKYLTIPEEEEAMHGQQATVGISYPSANSSKPTASMQPPSPSSPISNHSSDVMMVVADMASCRDRLNKLRDNLVATDPRDISHMGLANELASVFRNYAELSDRLVSLTA